MITYRVAEAAEILGVSDDTLRRWVEAGKVGATSVDGRSTIAGEDLAALAESLAGSLAGGLDPDPDRAAAVSARNRLTGIVVRVKKDTVMAQVDLICGPFRVVSLMSAEAADELGLAPGVRALASVKSTSVVVERPR